MPIAGVVAGALCASVGWLVVTQGLRTTRSQRALRLDSDRALVTDCLANVDRVIELPTFERPPDLVIDLRRLDAPALDHVIDLSEVQPRHAPVAVATPRYEPITLEPPSIWRVPTTHDPRSAAATA